MQPVTVFPVPTLPFDISLEMFVWGTFLITALLFTVVTIVFFYHWKKYGQNKKVMKIATLIYTAVSCLLLLLILGSALSATSL